MIKDDIKIIFSLRTHTYKFPKGIVIIRQRNFSFVLIFIFEKCENATAQSGSNSSSRFQLQLLVFVYSPLTMDRQHLCRTSQTCTRSFKQALSLNNSAVCWRDKPCSSRTHHPRVQHPRGPEGGNLEPVMHSWFAYDLPHMTRHAMPMATGNWRSMCGQRKYLAGKRRPREETAS